MGGRPRVWEREGCPYNAALTLAGADNESALRQALAQLRALGGTRASAIVARQLRERVAHPTWGSHHKLRRSADAPDGPGSGRFNAL
jgi:hypothetical protein